jgi:predicted acyl esterase
MMRQRPQQRLVDVAPDLDRFLTRGAYTPPLTEVPPRFAVSDIRCETVWITMRDGVRLATDLYLPPQLPAPAIAMRTPYDRAVDGFVGAFLSFARRGYVVISQDCRGTGNSEPNSWDYYVYEREDSFDFVEWVTRQPWFDGFLSSLGGSYVAQTQWCMAMHPRMSTIVPQVGGLGIASRTVHKYLFCNSYARSVGKGADKVPVAYHELERLMLEETLAGGYFNEPLHKSFSDALLECYPNLHTLSHAEGQRWLWKHYCSLSCEQRAELIKLALGVSNVTNMSIDALQAVFGHRIAHDAYMFPCVEPSELCHALHAPALMITGWYDWSINDTLATWKLLRREARQPVRSHIRLIITPAAHNMPGYHEGREDHTELERNFGTPSIVDLLLHWYKAVREGATNSWPTVIYYLLGANEWRVASDWPPPETRLAALYLGTDGTLTAQAPEQSSAPDRYTYDPHNPTPTVGGSIVSYVYRPGSVDVSEVQKRSDVLSYTTAPLERDFDVVGSLHLILYASSSALDTDFSARLSDVFPDGRAIQLQSGIWRARYRNGEPELLEPSRVYRYLLRGFPAV